MGNLRRDLLNAPNAITAARIAMIPLILAFTYYEGRVNSFVAGGLFALTGATDFLDGWLARRTGKVTVVGKFLDPLADKLIVMSVLIMLVHLGRVPAWLVILILAREFTVTGLRTMAMSEGIVIAAGQEGKYKTDPPARRHLLPAHPLQVPGGLPRLRGGRGRQRGGDLAPLPLGGLLALVGLGVHPRLLPGGLRARIRRARRGPEGKGLDTPAGLTL